MIDIQTILVIDVNKSACITIFNEVVIYRNYCVQVIKAISHLGWQVGEVSPRRHGKRRLVAFSSNVIAL